MDNNLLPMVANLPSMADLVSSKSAKVTDHSDISRASSATDSESVSERSFKDVLKSRESRDSNESQDTRKANNARESEDAQPVANSTESNKPKEKVSASEDQKVEEQDDNQEGVATPQVMEMRPVMVQVEEVALPIDAAKTAIVTETANVAVKAQSISVGKEVTKTEVKVANPETAEIARGLETDSIVSKTAAPVAPIATDLQNAATESSEGQPVTSALFDEALANAEGKANGNLLEKVEQTVQVKPNSQLSKEGNSNASPVETPLAAEAKEMAFTNVQKESNQSISLEKGKETKSVVQNIEGTRLGAQNISATNTVATPIVTQIAEPARLSETLAMEVVSQVQTQIKTSVAKGKQNFSFTLNPEELGEVKIHFTYRADGVEVALQATSGTTNDLLSKHLNELRSSLAESGINVANLNVESDGQQQGNQSFSFQQWQENGQKAAQMAELPWSEDLELENGYYVPEQISNDAQVNYFV